MQRLSAILVRPESDSASACLRAGRPGFKVRDPGPQLGAQLGDLCREPRIEVRNLGPHLGEAGPELIGGNVVALFEAAVMDRLGDDFELVALDAAGGELLGDGERVEHTGGSLPCARHGAKQPLPSGPIPVDFEAKPIQPDRRFSRSGPGNTGPLQLTVRLLLDPEPSPPLRRARPRLGKSLSIAGLPRRPPPREPATPQALSRRSEPTSYGLLNTRIFSLEADFSVQAHGSAFTALRFSSSRVAPSFPFHSFHPLAVRPSSAIRAMLGEPKR